MYFGSVRFFKHLILSVITLMILVPTAGCFVLMAQVQSLQRELESQKASLHVPVNDVENRDEDIPEANEGSDEQKAPEEGLAPNILDGDLVYQGKYPWLCVDKAAEYVTPTEKTVYLTFDDGPSTYTAQVLDILAAKDAPSTFFVKYDTTLSDDDRAAMYRRIVKEGHTLAIHSAFHQYSVIYSSIEAYLDDFAFLSEKIEGITGVKSDIFRFPGGSKNDYIKPIREELIAEMTRRGYTYYDWDVTSASADANATKESIYSYVTSGVSGANRQSAVVLIHDAGPAAAAVVAALPDIIDSLKTSGYKFEVLNNKVKPPQIQ
ncbi:MAG: polysaccharide deacetylase [Clostridiales bacterium]|nr:polysaccharide deacetylase [Clostridiales bacterium]